jgi:hypothetical protein
MSIPLGNGTNGRDRKGRFMLGNPGGPGNPQLLRTYALRKAFQDAVTPAQMQALARKLYTLAMDDDDISAAKLLLGYCLGPEQALVFDTSPTDEHTVVVTHYDDHAA